MKRNVIRRDEMLTAQLRLGGRPIDLSAYASTGLLAIACGPRGNGKTNAGLLIAEQLAEQGWVSVLIDPESELEALYGTAVPDPEALRDSLAARTDPIVVVSAKDAGEFVPYGRTILEAAEEDRKPVFVVVDRDNCSARAAGSNRAISVKRPTLSINLQAGAVSGHWICSSPLCDLQAHSSACFSPTRT
jgi:hypothetical protein